MKKIFFMLLPFLLVQTTYAQETIPLFDDMPSFQESQKKNTQAEAVKPITSEQDKADPNTEMAAINNTTQENNMPRLGRNAKPLDSIVLAPFPGNDISVDLDVVRPAQVTKQFKEEQKSISEEEILKRADPLTVTETDRKKDYMDRMIEAKRARQNKQKGQTNPLGRHDVHGFEVAGLSIGLTPDDVEDILSNAGFKLVKVEQNLPDMIRSSYAKKCKEEGLYALEDINTCVDERVVETQMYYIKSLTYERPQLREKVQIEFTTPLTENVSYRISYSSKGDHSLGTSRASQMEKQKRRNEFWQLIFDTYGLPDDPDKLIWGDPDNAYMKVAMIGTGCDAYIILEDLFLSDSDYEKTQEEVQDVTVSKPQFGFASGDAIEEVEE